MHLAKVHIFFTPFVKMKLQKERRRKNMQLSNFENAQAYHYYIRADNRTYADAMERGNYGVAIVMAQQSTEKALKGILQVFGDLQKLRTSHDLWKLYRACCYHGYVAENINKEKLLALTDSYFAARYPKKNQNDPVMFSYDDADAAGTISHDIQCLYHRALEDARAKESEDAGATK